MRSIETSFRLIDAGSHQRRPEVIEINAVGQQRGRVGLHTHGRLMSAADAHQSYAGQLRNFLCESCIGEVFDTREREGFRRYRQCHYRRIRWVRFAVDGWCRQIGWQKSLRGINGRLHFLFGDVDVQVEGELKSDDRAAVGTNGCHLV